MMLPLSTLKLRYNAIFSCGDKLAGHLFLLIFLLEIVLGTQIAQGRHQQYQMALGLFREFIF